jgi:hypothetical protein
VSRSSKACHRDGSPLEITNGFDLRLGKTVSRIDTGLGAKRDQISATETVQNHGTATDRAYVELSRSVAGTVALEPPEMKSGAISGPYYGRPFFYGNPKGGRTCESV